MSTMGTILIVIGAVGLFLVIVESAAHAARRWDERQREHAMPFPNAGDTDPVLEPPVATSHSNAHLGSSIEGLARHLGDNLRGLNPNDVHRQIASQGSLMSMFGVGKQVSDDQKTIKVLTSAHAVNMTVANNATELLDKALTFGRKRYDLELLPLEKQVKQGEMETRIASLAADKAEADARKRAAENPSITSPAHSGPNANPESASDPVAELMAHIRGKLKARGPTARRAARKQLEEEARQTFKGDADGFAAYMEAVDRALTEDARP